MASKLDGDLHRRVGHLAAYSTNEHMVARLELGKGDQESPCREVS